MFSPGTYSLSSKFRESRRWPKPGVSCEELCGDYYKEAGVVKTLSSIGTEIFKLRSISLLRGSLMSSTVFLSVSITALLTSVFLTFLSF